METKDIKYTNEKSEGYDINHKIKERYDKIIPIYAELAPRKQISKLLIEKNPNKTGLLVSLNQLTSLS